MPPSKPRALVLALTVALAAFAPLPAIAEDDEEVEPTPPPIVFPVIGEVYLHRHLRRPPFGRQNARRNRPHERRCGQGPPRRGRRRRCGRVDRLGLLPPGGRPWRGMGDVVHPPRQRHPGHRRWARMGDRPRYRGRNPGCAGSADRMAGRFGQRRGDGAPSALRDPQGRSRPQPLRVSAGGPPGRG
jgi:hypothetical protein